MAQSPSDLDAVVREMALTVPELARWWAEYIASENYHRDEPYTSMTKLAGELARLRLESPATRLSRVFEAL
jgi:hypothetical protein